MKKHIIIAFSFLAFATQVFAQQPVPESPLAAGKPLSIKHKLFTHYYEGDTEISKYAFNSKLATNTLAYKSYRSGRRLRIAANIIGIPSGFVMGWNIGSLIFRNTVHEKAFISSSIVWAIAFGMETSGEAKMKKAIKKYNQSTDIGYRFNINPNGVGLALQF